MLIANFLESLPGLLILPAIIIGALVLHYKEEKEKKENDAHRRSVDSYNEFMFYSHCKRQGMTKRQIEIAWDEYKKKGK